MLVAHSPKLKIMGSAKGRLLVKGEALAGEINTFVLGQTLPL